MLCSGLFEVLLIVCLGWAAVVSSQLAADMEEITNPSTREFPAPKVGPREVQAYQYKANLAMSMAVAGIIFLAIDVILKGV